MDGLSLTFLFGAAIVNSAIPGPCFLVTTGRAAEGGLAAGLRVASGVVTATAIFVAVSWAVMLGALAVAPAAFVAMKAAGIVVLVVIALAMLRPAPARAGAVRRWRVAGDLGAGVAVGLASPFNLVFMLAVLPQFIAVEQASPALFAITLSVVLAGTAPPLAAAIALGSGCGGMVPGAAPWIGRAGALTLLGFAGAATLTFP